MTKRNPFTISPAENAVYAVTVIALSIGALFAIDSGSWSQAVGCVGVVIWCLNTRQARIDAEKLRATMIHESLRCRWLLGYAMSKDREAYTPGNPDFQIMEMAQALEYVDARIKEIVAHMEGSDG